MKTWVRSCMRRHEMMENKNWNIGLKFVIDPWFRSIFLFFSVCFLSEIVWNSILIYRIKVFWDPQWGFPTRCGPRREVIRYNYSLLGLDLWIMTRAYKREPTVRCSKIFSGNQYQYCIKIPLKFISRLFYFCVDVSNNQAMKS